MEQRFGRDFSRVLVHSGGAAERSAQEINAQAYTVVPDLVFGPDRFAPETMQGQRLLAHELTHIVQQSGAVGSAMPVQRQTPPNPAEVTAATETKEGSPAKPAGTTTEGGATGEAELSPLRKELFKLFGTFEKKVVGDPEFDDIEPKRAWDKTRADEAAATLRNTIDKAGYDEAFIKYREL